jgi:2-polyprenyl-3-methyl-5-hydroxy-6-metoxy-1,4-benzoquinol methylase
MMTETMGKGRFMTTEKRDFDKEAVSWDEQPGRVKLAKDIAQAISQHIPLTHEMDIMDFGCGTGLLSVELQPFVRSITGVDSSQGMLDIFNAKIAKLNLDNVNTLLVDLDKGDTLTGKYDLVASSMTFHHIKEIKPLIAEFYKMTRPGGYLCIADLDLDQGQFHSDNTGVFHFGFDRVALRKFSTEAGFVNVRDVVAAEVVKPDKNGEMRNFSVFLLIGKKRPLPIVKV